MTPNKCEVLGMMTFLPQIISGCLQNSVAERPSSAVWYWMARSKSM